MLALRCCILASEQRALTHSYIFTKPSSPSIIRQSARRVAFGIRLNQRRNERGRRCSPLSRKGRGLKRRVHINPNKYFDDVPQVAWEFHIGGYQPAQKWLKDRKGMALSFEDVMHYQKIVKILCETDRIMKLIVLPL